MKSRRIVLLALATAHLGCLNLVVPSHKQGDIPAQVHAPVVPHNAFETLKLPPDAHAELCEGGPPDHPNFPDDADLITKVFCQDKKPGGTMPTPHNLNDLLTLLGLDFKDPTGGNGQNGNPGFALLAHSSALTARKVTSITPTAFVFTPPPADGSKPMHYAFVAFDPGEQFVEVAVDDATVGTLNFYLVLFDKDCTTTANCTNVDLLTQNVTKGWGNVRVYEDETSLNNTIADCHVCHNTVDGQPKMLRMQEIEAPFTHWMSMQTEGGRALYADFRTAHSADEDYGPIPAALVDKSDPALMAQMVKQAGFADQPNPFPSATIEKELKALAPMQPLVNVPMGWSQTWQSVYEFAVGGTFIAAPYHDVKVTDPAKLKIMAQAFRDWKAGTRSDLPDIREAFLDAGLRDMGFAPQAGLDGRGLLKQMCQECHNANLDPTLSREKFLVDQLDKMPKAEKQLAIQRLKLPDDDRLRMPPSLFRTVSDAETQAMIAELSK